MSDLDARIRSYASRSAAAEAAPPDFDAAFEQAVLAPRRRTAWVWSGLAAACVVALAVVVSVASSGGSGGTHVAAAGPSASAESTDPSYPAVKTSAEAAAKRMYELGRVAIREAEANGDKGAFTTARAVHTTRQKALDATGGGGSGGADNDVYLIELTGDFTCERCSVPAGAAQPHGRYLYLIVDDTSFEQSDYSFGNDRADLAALGMVVTLFP